MNRPFGVISITHSNVLKGLSCRDPPILLGFDRVNKMVHPINPSRYSPMLDSLGLLERKLWRLVIIKS